MFVNLGCGNERAPAPWVNVDQYRGPGVCPDVRAEAEDLPFPDRSVDRVYCGHLLEHLLWCPELPAVLTEIRRVLVPDGWLCVVGPDYDRAVAGDPEWQVLVPGIVHGGNRWPGDQHRWVSTGPRTLAAVRGVFPFSAEVAVTNLPHWPLVDDVGWQFAILARAAS